MDARQLFHARFALLSGHPVDTAQVEPWDRYRARVHEDHVAELRALWEHARRQQTVEEPRDCVVDDGMRAAIERWFDRTERRLRSRTSSAQPEPNRLRATTEAMVMTDYLLNNVRPREPWS
ncbi:MAG TPA: hypothetical protein VGN81_08310 [Pseudonocardiaceae bacterium]|jgi:hypothetical protein